MPVPRRRQSPRGRRELHANFSRPQPEPDHLRQCAARRRRDRARMNLAVALVVGLAAGLHAATWGMFKDAPYEGFTWPTYLRSPVTAAVIAVVVAAAGDFPSTNAAGIAVLFGLTYVIERGINEFYK